MLVGGTACHSTDNGRMSATRTTASPRMPQSVVLLRNVARIQKSVLLHLRATKIGMMANMPSAMRYAVPETGSRPARYSVIVMPRSQSTSANSALSRRPSATRPIAILSPAVVRMARRRTTQRAAKKLTTIITGVSISSAVLVPIRGTTRQDANGRVQNRPRRRGRNRAWPI